VTAEAIAPTSLEMTCSLRVESVERFRGDLAQIRADLDAFGIDHDVRVVAQTEAEARRLEEVFGPTQLAAEGRLRFVVGQLSEGFRLVPSRTLVLSASELFHRQEADRSSRRQLGRAIDSFLDLRDGDLVVHVAHGIARYQGLKLLEKEGRAEEHLEIEYHGGTKIFVPAAKIELVQKYVGAKGGTVPLAHIGGARLSHGSDPKALDACR